MFRLQHLSRPLSLGLRQTYVSTTARKSTMPSSDITEQEQEFVSNSLEIPFSRAKIGKFFQEQPQLGNQFTEDSTLVNYLQRTLPTKVYDDVASDLSRFGARVANEIEELGRECERNPPVLRQYDAWGTRVDDIITCEAWKKQKNISAEEGLIATAYERKHQEWSRLHQVAKLYLYAPSSGLYSCPLAMTDGAAKTIEVTQNGMMKENAYFHLTSRDPAEFWTSGQWMTERKGGSDVANGTQTYAVPQPDGTYKLYGYKWFTSATDSDMTLTLARVVGDDGNVIEGTKGLAMFFLKVRNEDGKLNNIDVQRLKDKLGTRQLPTAELLLDGADAHMVTDTGRGVPGIATMLSLTRLHNTVSSASSMRRIINLARDFTTKRECFGKIIKDHKIHIRNMANMEIEARSATLLALDLARLLGREDCGLQTEHEAHIFRLMTPVAKLYTAKQAVAVTSEGLECFGGAGYLEDTGLPTIYRDAQVLPIWEGTTNILSLDVMRALVKSRGAALEAFHKEVHQRTQVVSQHQQLSESGDKVKAAADTIVSFARQNIDKLEISGREFAFSLARTYMGMLMIEAGSCQGAKPHDVMAAKRWCDRDLVPVDTESKLHGYSDSEQEFSLVFDGYKPTTKSKI